MAATPTQLAAIAADGNVLVAAGAGAGKTSTLVERCVQRLLDPGCRATLEEILMVTFTESAAAEMRARVRLRLESAITTIADGPGEDSWPGMREHAEEQLALLDTSNICTLHSFCFKLVRQHFHELGIDPQVIVLNEAHAAVLMEETLDYVIHKYYSNQADAPDREMSEAVQRLVKNCGGGSEEPIRALVIRLHEYAQTLVDPAAWLDAQSSLFSQPEPTQWRLLLLQALQGWRCRWAVRLRESENPGGAARRRDPAVWDQIASSIDSLTEGSDINAFGEVLRAMPRKENFKRGTLRPPDTFFSETAFLMSLAGPAGADPLAQDWEWVRGDMAALLRVTAEFSAAFARSKREQAALDFHDLEQFTLRLLRDPITATPTQLARTLQQQLRFLFIDECQDINAAQDAILRALSNEEQPNRFLVGDVKQSIYRFRLADPRIFQQYEREWRDGNGGRVIPLQENFRSREALINFFNAVFSDLMREQAGGVGFDASSMLVFGARDTRQPLAASGPRVHVHLLITSPETQSSDLTDVADAAESEVATLTTTEQEARLVATALAQLRRDKHRVWDDGDERDVEWRDMAVLLRSPAGKAQIYAREFARQGIPLAVAHNEFYQCLEILDLLNVLTILDNPLQDIPLLSVLHSPICGLSTTEMAEVRLCARRENFWTALKVFHEARSGCGAWTKVNVFLERFSRWRRMGRDTSLSSRLHAILAETSYVDWLIAQSNNPERACQCVANVQRLLTLAEQFDPFQRQGLTRFLRFVAAQQQAPGREPMANTANAVQLISIHRSKGLEYPVVVVPDLAKKFNFQDLTATVLIDSNYGLCPKINSPLARQRYPSLTHWMSAHAERSEILGEELRLLYVAMTRARDTLLLVGAAKRSTAEKWSLASGAPGDLLAANSMLAWLGPWLARHASAEWLDQNGNNNLFSWQIHEPGEASRMSHQDQDVATSEAKIAPPADISCLLASAYQHTAATQEAAKASVSSLRRKMLQEDDEARPWFRPQRLPGSQKNSERSNGLTAAEIGVVHHTFLEFADLKLLNSLDAVRAEADRLTNIGALTPTEAAHLDLDSLASFWCSDLGRQIRAARDVRRELPFTARFNCAELPSLGLATGAVPDHEFIVVQGVVDLAVLFDDEIWLLDFKTDAVTDEGADERAAYYKPQVAAYSAALERIYPTRRVTRRCLHFLAARKTVEV